MGAGGEVGDPATGAGRDANEGRTGGAGGAGGGSARRIAAIRPRVISLRSLRRASG